MEKDLVTDGSLGLLEASKASYVTRHTGMLMQKPLYGAELNPRKPKSLDSLRALQAPRVLSTPLRTLVKIIILFILLCFR